MAVQPGRRRSSSPRATSRSCAGGRSTARSPSTRSAATAGRCTTGLQRRRPAADLGRGRLSVRLWDGPGRLPADPAGPDRMAVRRGPLGRRPPRRRRRLGRPGPRLGRRARASSCATLIQPPATDPSQPEWLAIAPGGYLAASPELLALVRWRVGGTRGPARPRGRRLRRARGGRPLAPRRAGSDAPMRSVDRSWHPRVRSLRCDLARPGPARHRCAVLVPSARAQTSYPMLGRVEPTAVQRGQTVGGHDLGRRGTSRGLATALRGARAVGRGARRRRRHPKARPRRPAAQAANGSVKARLTVAADAPLGPARGPGRHAAGGLLGRPGRGRRRPGRRRGRRQGERPAGRRAADRAAGRRRGRDRQGRGRGLVRVPGDGRPAADVQRLGQPAGEQDPRPPDPLRPDPRAPRRARAASSRPTTTTTSPTPCSPTSSRRPGPTSSRSATRPTRATPNWTYVLAGDRRAGARPRSSRWPSTPARRPSCTRRASTSTRRRRSRSTCPATLPPGPWLTSLPDGAGPDAARARWW